MENIIMKSTTFSMPGLKLPVGKTLQMKRKIGLLAGVLALTGTCVAADVAAPVIIPAPVTMELGSGSFTLQASTPIVVKAGDEAAAAVARYLSATLAPATGYSLPVTTTQATGGAIRLQLDQSLALGAEGYQLKVTPTEVTITAAQAAGLFYGCQSLRQLLPPAIMAAKPATGGAWTIPTVSIEDQPRFAWRGMLLDVSRHFFSTAEIKRYLDILAFYKLNTFHWHLTDNEGWRIEIKKYPRLIEIGSIRAETDIQEPEKRVTDGKPYGPFFYTQNELREIVAYAAERHITIVPEIDMPGHIQSALAAYPVLGCTGEAYKVRGSYRDRVAAICAGNDQAFAFLEDVLTEVMAIFPSKYIHIGGDEVDKSFWSKCPKCQARIKAENLKDEKELQSYFIHRMEKFVNGRGRSIIGWDEILEGGLAPNATVMSWRGVKGGIEAAKQHHKVIMTPYSHLYFDKIQSAVALSEPVANNGPCLDVQMVYSYEPIPDELSPEESGYILGAQACVWTEAIATYSKVEYMSVPRLLAMAELLWTPRAGKDYGRFSQGLERHLPHLAAAQVNYRPLGPIGPIPTGAEIKWDNEGGDQRWANPKNWVGDTLPANNIAVIDGGATVFSVDRLLGGFGGIKLRDAQLVVTKDLNSGGVHDWRNSTVIVSNGATVNAAMSGSMPLTGCEASDTSAELIVTGTGSTWLQGVWGNQPMYVAAAGANNITFTMNLINGGVFGGKLFLGGKSENAPSAVNANINVNVYANSLAGSTSEGGGLFIFAPKSGSAKINLLGGDLRFHNAQQLVFAKTEATCGIYFKDLKSKLTINGDAAKAVQGWIDGGYLVNAIGDGFKVSVEGGLTTVSANPKREIAGRPF